MDTNDVKTDSSAPIDHSPAAAGPQGSVYVAVSHIGRLHALASDVEQKIDGAAERFVAEFRRVFHHVPPATASQASSAPDGA
jgi:hypothetical protein